MKLINMDVYQVDGLKAVVIKKSWDDTYYMEVPDFHPGGFGFPMPGVHLTFEIKEDNSMSRCAEYGYGGRIILSPHNKIQLSSKVAKLLIEANGKKENRAKHAERVSG